MEIFEKFEWYDYPVILFFANTFTTLGLMTLYGGGFLTGFLLVIMWECWKAYERFRAKGSTQLHFKVLENIIPEENQNEIIELFNSSEHLRLNKNGMDKLNDPWSFDTIRKLEPIIQQYVDTTKCIGDNVFKHKNPYFPHVDVKGYPCINFLIPLYINSGDQQYFIIFDQYVNNANPKTWIGHNLKEIKGDFNVNKNAGYIYKDDVSGLTDKDIDYEFYKEYLGESVKRRHDLFYGCTGHAIEYKPGNAIMFDSKYIHCTGKMNTDFKIGLSLRFKIKDYI